MELIEEYLMQSKMNDISCGDYTVHRDVYQAYNAYGDNKSYATYTQEDVGQIKCSPNYGDGGYPDGYSNGYSDAYQESK